MLQVERAIRLFSLEYVMRGKQITIGLEQFYIVLDSEQATLLFVQGAAKKVSPTVASMPFF